MASKGGDGVRYAGGAFKDIRRRCDYVSRFVVFQDTKVHGV